MIKIGVTCRLQENTSYFEVREALDIRWSSLLIEMGCLPIVLPINSSFIDYFKEIDIQGILLTGGNDLDLITPNKLSRKRDKFEKDLIKYALTVNIPILGVCRGMQIIAEYFGGTLGPVEGQVATRHKLKVKNSSRYFEELQLIKDVNSFHNFGIVDVPKDFIVSATNEQGIIKAIEAEKKMIYGQMWHSERDDPFDDNQLTLLKKVFDV